ncbi:MAG: Na+/glucose cotransporter [Candidatus Marinimicrobia bacterium]|nr:Na+/glucose cotransporter [Candidatus Neomarinimicrobiota bacterium]|tara:strand:+ start:1996 stop:3627 length:1632 start_codon:yes stop_codon:yes gene_type:complete
MTIFTTFDWIVLALFFGVLGYIIWWVINQKQDSTEEYFLAGRNLGWFVIGASIFASNIGSEHIVGLAGTAANSGMVMGHYELHSWIILLLGWVFVPFYLRSTVFTMPEFIERRYSEESRWILTVITLISYVLTKVSVTVYAGAVVFQTLMGIEFWSGALTIVILTGLYTVLGGLRAVIYTDAIQAIVLLVGSATITVLGLIKIGGWNNLVSGIEASHFNMFLPADHPDFPWIGMVFAPPIIGIWYWCTDQYIVQRVLSARDETQARRGTIFAGYLKILPIFMFFIPGLIAYALSKSGQMSYGSSDQVFPMLVRDLLPSGIRGLVAGGLLAALMSSLSSVFNSCSTLFTMDIYKKLNPNVEEKKLVFVGRLATGIVVLTGILWIPLMKVVSSGGLYKYLQSVQAYIAPPIAAVFLLGIFWKRINANGALATLISGFSAGMLRLFLEIKKETLSSGFWLSVAELNFLYFAIFSFLFSVIILIVVSLFTPEPNLDKLQGLTFGTVTQEDKKLSQQSWANSDLIHSVVIVLILILILVYFSPIGIGG